MTLGDVIAKYRLQNKISMDRFAELSGISKGYISMLERNQTQRGGEPSPSIDMYRSVARIINIDVDELIRMVEGNISLGMEKERPATKSDGLSDMDREVKNILQTLPEDAKRDALNYMKFLRENQGK